MKTARRAATMVATLLLSASCQVDRLLRPADGGTPGPPPPPPPLAPHEPTDLRQYRGDGQTPVAPGGTVPEQNIVIEARVRDPEPLDSLRLQLELRPGSQVFVGTPTHQSDFVTNGFVASIPVTLPDQDADYRWRVRAVDGAGRAGLWVTFQENEPAFRVVIPRLPAEPVNLGQFHADGRTPIPVGGTTGDRDVYLKATINDPTRSGKLTVEFEVRSLSSALTGQRTHDDDDVRHGETGSVRFRASSFVSYHWQARVCDEDECSPWLAFGGNPQGERDFFRNPFDDDDDLTGTAGPLD